MSTMRQINKDRQNKVRNVFRNVRIVEHRIDLKHFSKIAIVDRVVVSPCRKS